MTRSAAPPIAGRCARVLIADDDPRMRELLTGLVDELGHEVLAVPDGEAASRPGRAFEQVANGRGKG